MAETIARLNAVIQSALRARHVPGAAIAIAANGQVAFPEGMVTGHLQLRLGSEEENLYLMGKDARHAPSE